MNKQRKKPLVPKPMWSMVLLVTLVVASALAQTPVPSPADDDRGDATGEPPVLPSSELSAPSRFSLISPAGWLATLDERVSREFEKAWFLSGDGTTGREGVVLIFRMTDGSYRAKLQPITNQYRECTFRWNPAAIAIVHTHPNSCEPKPAEQDKRVADKFGVPNFTITISGMYVYDPATKKTSKLMNGLDWLNLPTIRKNSKGGSARDRIATSGS